MYRKTIIYSTILGIILLVYYYNSCAYQYNKKGPYQFLLTSDKDDVYSHLLYIENKMNEKQFDQFIREIYSEKNLELLSIAIVTNHIEFNNKVQYLELLKQKLKQLQHIQPDSTWYTKVSSNYLRQNSVTENSSAVYDLKKAIAKFDNK